MGALDGLRAVAASLHDTFGTAATLRSTAQTYDVLTQTTTDTDTDTTVYGVPAKYSAMEQGDTIQARDVKFTIAAQGNTTPTTAMTLVFDGVEYQIVSVKTQYGTDQHVYHELQLRQ